MVFNINDGGDIAEIKKRDLNLGDHWFNPLSRLDRVVKRSAFWI